MPECSRRKTHWRSDRELREPENPVQIAIADVMSQFCGVAVTDMAVGIDGCAAPVFGITMKAMALAYARLISPPASSIKPRVMHANESFE